MLMIEEYNGAVEKVELESGVLTVGRAHHNGLPLHHSRFRMVSSNHAKLYEDNGQWYVQDLASMNGTYLNGVKIGGPEQLQTGDTLQLASNGPLFRISIRSGSEAILRLIVLAGSRRGTTHLLHPGRNLLGTGDDCALRFDPLIDATVDPCHVEIQVQKSSLAVVDLGSREGTFLNGQPIRQARLQHGDRIILGLNGPELAVEVFTSLHHDGKTIYTPRPERSNTDPQEYPTGNNDGRSVPDFEPIIARSTGNRDQPNPINRTYPSIAVDPDVDGSFEHIGSGPDSSPSHPPSSKAGPGEHRTPAEDSARPIERPRSFSGLFTGGPKRQQYGQPGQAKKGSSKALREWAALTLLLVGSTVVTAFFTVVLSGTGTGTQESDIQEAVTGE